MEWPALYMGPVVKPVLTDSEEEGLVANACECQACPAGAAGELQCLRRCVRRGAAGPHARPAHRRHATEGDLARVL